MVKVLRAVTKERLAKLVSTKGQPVGPTYHEGLYWYQAIEV